MALVSAHPELYTVDETGAPTLTGVIDPDGHVSYPFQRFGSEVTGAYGDRLTPIALAGTGTVTARAEVQHHPAGDLPTPFTVAAIALDEGPLIRGLLVDGASVAVGERVRAITVPVHRGDDEAAELRFSPEREEPK
jgi:uncharacterized protein